MENITIGKLAQLSGVGVETVRFYQRKGLIREPRATGAFRKYSEDDAKRIIFIRKAQELGFSLQEIGELLDLNSSPKRQTCGTVKREVLKKINEIDGKIDRLQAMRTSLVRLSTSCDPRRDEFRKFKVEECFALNISAEEIQA